jgi:hypothetical protein
MVCRKGCSVRGTNITSFHKAPAGEPDVAAVPNGKLWRKRRRNRQPARVLASGCALYVGGATSGCTGSLTSSVHVWRCRRGRTVARRSHDGADVRPHPIAVEDSEPGGWLIASLRSAISLQTTSTTDLLRQFFSPKDVCALQNRAYVLTPHSKLSGIPRFRPTVYLVRTEHSHFHCRCCSRFMWKPLASR